MVRYTLQEDEELNAKVREFLRSVNDGYLIIQHDKDEEVQRTHWHALVYRRTSMTTLRNDWKKQFPDLNKHDWSMGNVADPSAYIRYMCHADCEGGEVNVIASHGLEYTKEFFVAQNKAFYEHRREHAKKAKRPKKPFHEQALERCQSRGCQMSRWDIAREVVRLKMSMKAVLNMFYLKSVVNYVDVAINGNEAEEALITSLV